MTEPRIPRPQLCRSSATRGNHTRHPLAVGTRRQWPCSPSGQEDRPAQQQPQQTFQRRSSTQNRKNTVPTRETSPRTGCRVGSSSISPAATMGIMAVKILVRKVQTDTEKVKTGRQEGKPPHTHQQKGLLVVRVRGGTVCPPITC